MLSPGDEHHAMSSALLVTKHLLDNGHLLVVVPTSGNVAGSVFRELLDLLMLMLHSQRASHFPTRMARPPTENSPISIFSRKMELCESCQHICLLNRCKLDALQQVRWTYNWPAFFNTLLVTLKKNSIFILSLPELPSGSLVDKKDKPRFSCDAKPLFNSLCTDPRISRKLCENHGCWCPGSLRHQFISYRGSQYFNSSDAGDGIFWL